MTTNYIEVTQTRHGFEDPKTNLGWTLEEASTVDDRHHWAAVRTPHTPPESRFDHYVDF